MITRLLEPQEFQSVYNELMLVLDSDKKLEDKFQYVIDVTIDGTPMSRFKIPSNAEGYGVMDLHKHIEPFVDYNLDTTSSNNIHERVEESYAVYNVELSEEYVYTWDFGDNYWAGVIVYDGDTYNNMTGFNLGTTHYFQLGDRVKITQDTGFLHPEYNGIFTVIDVPDAVSIVVNLNYEGASPVNPGVGVIASNSVTIIPSIVTLTSNKLAFNGVFKWEDVSLWNYSVYKAYQLGGSGKMLSNMYTNSDVQLEDIFDIHFYKETNNLYYTRITTDNGVFDFYNQYQVNLINNKFIKVKCSPWHLTNTTQVPVIISGALPVLDSNSTYYEVKFIDNLLGNSSETRRFNLVAPCSLYETYRFIYLDKFGAFASTSFNKVNKKKTTIKRDTYKKNYGSYNSVANTWGYSISDRGTKNYNMEVEDIITINSDWQSELNAQRILDMLESPEVYHIDENNNIYGINILNTSWDKKQTINDIIFNYTIDFKYSFKNKVNV